MYDVKYKFAPGVTFGSMPIHPQVGKRYVVADLSDLSFREMFAREILQNIDKFALNKWNDNNGLRKHLGASLIGQECTRKTYYAFHWMAVSTHDGRMQRLFQRGHLEEFRYVEYLEGIGAKLWPFDPNLPLKDGKPQQWKVSKIRGHFGGSLDGIVSFENWGVPGYMLAEFKTKGAGKDGNGAKFAELKAKGIMLTNPQHYDQMSTYGAEYKLEYSLYMSTNKNDDDMHVEIVPLNFRRAAEVEAKAAYIIDQTTPPPRISMNPTHYHCKGCDFLQVCHYNRVPLKNCRSCLYSRPVDEGMWYCLGHKLLIPDEVVRTGCPQWDFIKSPPA